MKLTKEDFYDSPFEPGKPASPHYFKGRIGECKKIIRYLPKVINTGIPQHFFITGKRGMGKTSFVKYVGDKVEKDFQMLPIYVNNEWKDNVHELIQLILEGIIEELDKTKKGKKIIENFISDINEIKSPGVGITLDKKQDFVKNVKNNFQIFYLI